MLNAFKGIWITQIVATMIKRLAGALAGGISTVAGLLGVLTGLEHAELIASTEITRAMSQGALFTYQEAGATHVRWVVHSKNPCQRCLDNQAAGPWLIGVPFPSGAMAPPDHPNCECALVRA